jgi:hypothetical protein
MNQHHMLGVPGQECSLEVERIDHGLRPFLELWIG